MQSQLAGVYGWEEIFTEKWHQRERGDDAHRKQRRYSPACVQRTFKHTAIARAKSLEGTIEPCVYPLDQANLAVVRVFIIQRVPHQRRYQCARDDVGRHHRKHHRHRERRKQRTSRTAQKKDRYKHDADGEHTDKCRHGNFLCTIEHGLLDIAPQRNVAMNVFNANRRVVYQTPTASARPHVYGRRSAS